MKVAIIGAGKSGSKVIELLGKDQIQGIYDSKNPPNALKLHGADVAICFVTGEVALSIYQELIEVKLPAVWASTGLEWPNEIDSLLKEKKIPWIVANNFSLGMTLIRHMIKILAKAKLLVDEPSFHIHDIHHAKKLDSPSGTAIWWKNWIEDEKCSITSERIGDVNGIHEITMNTPFESITLKHEAHDRKLFAKGAIEAARLICQNKVNPGLNSFEDITDKMMEQK